MSLPGTFKKLFAMAGGATATFLAVTYVSQLFRIKLKKISSDVMIIIESPSYT